MRFDVNNLLYILFTGSIRPPFLLRLRFLIAASSATCTRASRHFYEEEEGFGVEIVEGKVPEEGAQDDVCGGA